MICETCHGKGMQREFLSLMGGEIWQDVPCSTCGGCGIDYCCGGSERYGQLDGGLPGEVSGPRSKRVSTGDGEAFDTTSPSPLDDLDTPEDKQWARMMGAPE